MDELHKALGDISVIRRQVAETTEFRGYGPATLAATGFLAVSAGLAQGLWVAQPGVHVIRYVALWYTTAFLSVTLSGFQMFTRSRRLHSRLSGDMIRMAVEQFVPALAAGLLLTLVLLRTNAELAWLLPGLWQVTFGLGIFASCRFLPRPVAFAGLWYLLTGLLCVGCGDNRALSPWAMAIPFGAGQMLISVILYLSAKERRNEA